MIQKLYQRLGIPHMYSTPYHPQPNGQVERFNSTMDAKIASLSKRINVLEQAHTAHREDISLAHMMFLGAIGSISYIVIIIFIIVIFTCHCLHCINCERQPPALPAFQSSGLSSIYPMTNVLFNTLQQLHTMERNNHAQPSCMFSSSPFVPTNSNTNPLFSNALKL